MCRVQPPKPPPTPFTKGSAARLRTHKQGAHGAIHYQTEQQGLCLKDRYGLTLYNLLPGEEKHMVLLPHAAACMGTRRMAMRWLQRRRQPHAIGMMTITSYMGPLNHSALLGGMICTDSWYPLGSLQQNIAGCCLVPIGASVLRRDPTVATLHNNRWQCLWRARSSDSHPHALLHRCVCHTAMQFSEGALAWISRANFRRHASLAISDAACHRMQLATCRH